ncbi:guanine nucleotide-binding protein alpha-1 subunit [Tanacetum coccineum]
MGLLCSRHKRGNQANTEENAHAAEIERRIEQETKAEKHIQKLLLLGALIDFIFMYWLTISPNVEVSFFKLLRTTDDIEDMTFDVYALLVMVLSCFVTALQDDGRDSIESAGFVELNFLSFSHVDE